MGSLDKAALDALIAAGCSACGETTLTFQTYVDGLIPLMAGEPVGKLKWVYNGEKFLDGIYEIACARCKEVVFASADCPRCHATGALATALATENSYPVPTACPGCESEEVRYIAFMPAKATYEGKRAEKARTSVEMHDPGCATCGCQLDSTPQGVAHFDAMTSVLPLVIPSKTFTTGMGPFTSTAFDTGPAGLTYGTDRILYVGNVDINGDYYRLDLATQSQTLVTTFASRVYASAPFDAITMLVALEGGEIRLLHLNDGSSTPWTMSSNPIVGMVRDFFDGSVYVSRRDNGIWKYDSTGNGALFQTAANPARISVAPDGWLYALEIPPPFGDQTPTVARFQLPLTR